VRQAACVCSFVKIHSPSQSKMLLLGILHYYCEFVYFRLEFLQFFQSVKIHLPKPLGLIFHNIRLRTFIVYINERLFTECLHERGIVYKPVRICLQISRTQICPPYFPRPFRGLYDKKRAKYHLMDALSSRVECMDP
jgi:hypothetical protein